MSRIKNKKIVQTLKSYFTTKGNLLTKEQYEADADKPVSIDELEYRLGGYESVVAQLTKDRKYDIAPAVVKADKPAAKPKAKAASKKEK